MLTNSQDLEEDWNFDLEDSLLENVTHWKPINPPKQ